MLRESEQQQEKFCFMTPDGAGRYAGIGFSKGGKCLKREHK